MSFLGRLFRREKPEPNFVIMKDGREIPVHVPLAEKVKATQTDYVQSVLALARKSAELRRDLAAQTLINVHGKAPQ